MKRTDIFQLINDRRLLQYWCHGQKSGGHRRAIATGYPQQRHVSLPLIAAKRGRQPGSVAFREQAPFPDTDYRGKTGQDVGAEPQAREEEERQVNHV